MTHDEKMKYFFGQYHIEVKYVKKPHWVTDDWREIGPVITGLRNAAGEISRKRAMNPKRQFRLVLVDKIITYTRKVIDPATATGQKDERDENSIRSL